MSCLLVLGLVGWLIPPLALAAEMRGDARTAAESRQSADATVNRAVGESNQQDSARRDGDVEPAATDRFDISRRVPWTTSRVVGSPDPPLPYRVERAFPKLKFDQPVYMIPEPGTDRIFILTRYGKVQAFRDDRETDETVDLLELPTEPAGRQTYSLIFEPGYDENRTLLLFSNIPEPKQPEPNRRNRISRFRVSAEPPYAILPDSETVILEWPSAGHDGGDMAFGPDEMLYITAGDGTSGSDVDNTGQDLTDLTGALLRIDLTHPDPGKPYGIPSDNPFLNVDGARPEIWAFGLRAPWRLCHDEPTGNLWIGEVGQDLWEMIHLARRGANYGWSVMEGTHPFLPGRKLGPAPLVPPVVEHHHYEARSITGGYVYRGSKLPDLAGMYLYCDYETGSVWGFRYEQDQVHDQRMLADSTYKVAAWGRDHQGELYLVGHLSGEILELQPNAPSEEESDTFPRTLSETGLFASVADHRPAAGVIPYSVNAPAWADGARAQRMLAVPGDGKIGMRNDLGWDFEDGAVLVQTLSLDLEPGNRDSQRPIETRLLTRQGGEWHSYSYRWNDQQTDATLVDRLGDERTLILSDPQAPGGQRQQTWRFPARAECIGCHSRAANYVLGLTTVQMNREHDYGGVRDNQLRVFDRLGLFRSPLDKPPDELPRLADPYNQTADLDRRARSYLHTNCSQCHVSNGGGNAEMELTFATEPAKTAIFGVRPLHGDFGIPQASLVSPGNPHRSVLFYRLAKLGPGRMPRVGASEVDSRGLDLLYEWIRSLPPDVAEASRSQAAAAAVENDQPNPSAEAESATAASTVAGPEEPPAELVTADQIESWLSSVSGALALVRAIDTGRIPADRKVTVIRAGASHPDPRVRDLFERYLPENERVKRLGTAIDPRQIMALTGSAQRGRQIFFETAGVQCRNCHRVGDQGRMLGPDLMGMGKKYKRVELLESMLEPSKKIDPKFASYVLQTVEGRVVSGLLLEKTPSEIVIKDIEHNVIRIPADDVFELKQQDKSLMPDSLLRDLTAQQAADLLAYLESLR